MSRYQDQNSCSKDSSADQGKVPEEIFHLVLAGAVHEDLLDEDFQSQTNDQGRDSSHDDIHCCLPETCGASKEGPLPCIPEVCDDRDHGSGVKHHKKEGHRWAGRIQAHKLFSHNHVG